MKETSSAHILFATGVPGKPIRHTQGRELCRTAPPCLPRPNGVGVELHSIFLKVSVDQFS